MTAIPLQRIARQLALLVIRLSITAAKFLLALYTARFLSLADLGVYGLLIGATTIAPAVTSLGMTDWLIRKAVDRPTIEVMPLATTRLALTFALHLIAQPLAYAAIVVFNLPFPRGMAIVCGLILLLDNLANDASEILIARRHVFLANSLLFLRQGFWPLPVILIGLLDPSARTLEFLLAGWLAALVATCLGIAAIALHRGRWRHAVVRGRLLVEGLRGGMILYVKDVSGVFGAFVDRFLISLVLGLELTGVYTLFWSIANVVHSLSVFGVLQTHIARILGAGGADDKAAFASLERKLQVETGAWALLLAAGAAVVTPLFLPYLGRPLLEVNLPVFWVLLGATFLRIAADGYGFALLALHRDRDIAIIALGGAAASAALNAALTPLFGIMGAAIAAVATGAGLFLARYVVCRRSLGS